MRSTYIVLFILIIVSEFGIVTAQNAGTVFPGRTGEAVTGLHGILLNDEPALQLVTSKGGSIIIRLGNRDGEGVLAFPVVHMHQLLYAGSPGETGLIYVSKTHVSYVPDGKGSDHGFDVLRNELKKIEFSKSSNFGRNIGSNLLFKTNKKDYRFLVLIAGTQGVKHEDLLPAIDFLQKAVANFDAAMTQFKQLTTNVKQTGGVALTAIGRQLIETKNLSQITTKYDRFKDVTTVMLQTVVSKPDDPRYEMLGPTVSIVASYQFSGQIQKAPPEIVLFSFQIYVIEGNQTRYRDSFSSTEEFIVLADGERLMNRMERTELRDSVGGKYEIVSCPLTVATFAKLARSKKVEMRIGAYESVIKEYHLQAFRDLLAKAQP